MENKFTMSLSLNILNHLGINLYSNIPAVLSEIVANSWDADAENVYITIANAEIIIKDDGCGMTVDDINSKFLKVGYQKREKAQTSARFKRPFMGRKGIGKLSMFSIASEIDIISKIDGEKEINALRMNANDIETVIKEENKDSNYHPQELDLKKISFNTAGTKIILRSLKRGISSLTSDYIKKRVARRFGIIGKEHNFNIFVNDILVSIQDRDYFHKLEYVWYYGNESKKYADISAKATSPELRKNMINEKYSISGWIGSVDSAGDLKDDEENLNKIVILVRGKLGQEDILSEYSEGGLYSKYLIGEINADFFDNDDLDDMATSNRQEYRRDDERFVLLKNFIHEELKYIQNRWTSLRNETGSKKALELLPIISTWFKTLSTDDRVSAKKIFGKINQIPADNDKKRELLKYSVLAFEKLKYVQKLSRLDEIDIEHMDIIKAVFLGLDELEATLYYQIIKERVSIIQKFQQITTSDAREKIIQEYLFDHLWLLDPSWERVDSTKNIEKTVLKAFASSCKGLTQKEAKARLDITYRQTAGKHIIIELKRVSRVVSLGELIEQVNKYNDALKKVLSENGYKNAAYEIICVLGKPVDNNDSLDSRKEAEEVLKIKNARIVFYDELIENACKAYNEYLIAHKKSQPLIALFDELERDM